MILVTGAAGMSGVGRDRSKAGLLAFDNDNVEIVEGDMSRPETLGRALSGSRRLC
jgi:uncharacterized protein YbjT (DUF2867 family)